jgi:hypothetical protein
VTDTPAQFAAKLDDLASTFDAQTIRIITERVARKLKAPMTDAIQPNTLSHWGKGKRRGGYTVKARYDMRGQNAVLAPTAKPLAALLEEGGKGPWNNPRRGRRSSGGTYQRAGVTARHAWRPAVHVAQDQAAHLVDVEVQRVLRRLFSAG